MVTDTGGHTSTQADAHGPIGNFLSAAFMLDILLNRRSDLTLARQLANTSDYWKGYCDGFHDGQADGKRTISDDR